MLTHLFVPLNAVLEHQQLEEGGVVRIFVHEVDEDTEEPAVNRVWSSSGPGGKIPVVIFDLPRGSRREVTYLTAVAVAVGHRHPGGKTYRCIRGHVRILVEDEHGRGVIYGLEPGDAIHIFPGTIHQVLRQGCEFLVEVTTDQPLEGSRGDDVDTTTLFQAASWHSLQR